MPRVNPPLMQDPPPDGRVLFTPEVLNILREFPGKSFLVRRSTSRNFKRPKVPQGVYFEEYYRDGEVLSYATWVGPPVKTCSEP